MTKKLEFLFVTTLLILLFFFFIPMVLIKLQFIYSVPFILSSLLDYIGLALILSGVVIFCRTTIHFFSQENSTPLITQKKTKLLDKGIYGKMRNPMYVGHVAILLGQALLFGSVLVGLYAALSFLLLHMLVVMYEEPLTEKQLGKKYTNYMKKVKRWGVF